MVRLSLLTGIALFGVMTGSVPARDPDAEFVAMMIPHHQAAIEMSQAELRDGRNELLRRMAQEIIVTQQQEIGAMQSALGQQSQGISHRDRVYTADQFSNTVSVIDPVDNKLVGVIRLGESQPALPWTGARARHGLLPRPQHAGDRLHRHEFGRIHRNRDEHGKARHLRGPRAARSLLYAGWEGSLNYRPRGGLRRRARWTNLRGEGAHQRTCGARHADLLAGRQVWVCLFLVYAADGGNLCGRASDRWRGDAGESLLSQHRRHSRFAAGMVDPQGHRQDDGVQCPAAVQCVQDDLDGPDHQSRQFVGNKNGVFAYVSVGGLNQVQVFRTSDFTKVATIAVGRLPHGVWPSGDGSRIYVGLENDDQLAVINTLTNTVIATIPIGQAPQAIAYVSSAVPDGDGLRGLQALGVAGEVARLSLVSADNAGKPLTTVALFDQGLAQVLQAAVTGLEPKQPYVLALATQASGGGALEPLAAFTTNPAGAAIVNAVGPIRQIVRGDASIPRRYLVIASGTPGQLGARVQVQAP